MNDFKGAFWLKSSGLHETGGTGNRRGAKQQPTRQAGRSNNTGGRNTDGQEAVFINVVSNVSSVVLLNRMRLEGFIAMAVIELNEKKNMRRKK